MCSRFTALPASFIQSHLHRLCLFETAVLFHAGTADRKWHVYKMRLWSISVTFSAGVVILSQRPLVYAVSHVGLPAH